MVTEGKINLRIISSYTDEQAVDDGVLVDIAGFKLFLGQGPVNRITRNLYDELKKYADHDRRKLRGILREKLSYAYMPQDNPQDGYLYLLPPNLWAIRNELDGYTLMFPEDY